MSDGSIYYINSPVVIIIAIIVSPGCVSLWLNSSDGAAVAMDIKNIDRK